ncbi:hypothetical protein B7494_g3912 [Chlorociboria aeruginascens]|nr:hypothetical protein B7494_g3912 [Chlorociboria aeruginascens]
MPTLRRRSSRLRGSNATPGKSVNYAPTRLSSLAERDEAPTSGVGSNLDATASSPVAPRTPAIVSRIKPPREEMHPSKVQHSTTKDLDSGLRLGFRDVDASGTNQPSGLTQQTPSKTPFSSSPFNFQFAHPGPELGPDAQRMMDSLREESLRIKAKLAAEREEEKRIAREESVVGRKIAQPKGKVGRFSDVHMAEFRKMDSIAGHASSFRAQPGRFIPTNNNLKRTQSAAKLDDRDDAHSHVNSASEAPHPAERLENTAPAKRARRRVIDDTSSARPVSRDGNQALKTMPSTPNLARSKSNFLTSISTPTQSSLARASSIKAPASQIPTLSRSPSKPNVGGTPRGLTKSATTNNLGSLTQSEPQASLRSPGKLGRVKSMLRNPSFSKKKPLIASSIPSLTKTTGKLNLDKDLPSIPTTPIGIGRSKDSKHVSFTPDTVNKNAAAIPNSPSPMKSGIPRSTSKFNMKPLPFPRNQEQVQEKATEVVYPSIAGLPNLDKEIKYPSLGEVRPLPEPPRQVKTARRPPPSVPGTFTFRTDHTINFGSSPRGFGSSPGQASLRQVRASILPLVIPGSFPGGDKENSETLPSLPHGMANKKRRRVDSDDEETQMERSSKKQKHVAEGAALMAPNIMASKTVPASNVTSPAKKKAVLSLSRLNMLARPKTRK